MTQNEILMLLHKVVAENQQYTTWTVSTPHLVALVNQAIEAEREACAKVCEELAELSHTSDTDSMWEWGECAAAIRTRGNV